MFGNLVRKPCSETLFGNLDRAARFTQVSPVTEPKEPSDSNRPADSNEPAESHEPAHVHSEPLPRRGYLGFAVDARPAPAELADQRPERWIVSELTPGFSASESDLRLGDDLLCIDDVPVMSLAHLRSLAAAVDPGRGCRVRVLRGSETMEFALTAAEMPLEKLSLGRVELAEVPWTYQGEHLRLRAVWTHPVGASRAAVWLLPSAAWITQEVPLDADDPTFQLIDRLTGEGLSTLRVDRSGLGDSEGPHPRELDFAAEMSMWEAARTHFFERTQGARRCLFGRSLGGYLAPLLAREQPFAAVCVWGTSSRSWHEGMLQSVEHQRRLAGQDGAPLAQGLALVERLQRLVFLEGLSPAQARKREPQLAQVSPQEYHGELVYDRTARFFQQLQTYDIARAWAAVQADVLAIAAELDIIVPAAALEELVSRIGPRGRFACLPGVDHFMHNRSSLEEAVRTPWGGAFSEKAALMILEFFRDGALTREL